jgi:hypothetical protein
MPKERPMPERGEYWLYEVKRSDCNFLRKVGIKSCLLDDPHPSPLSPPFPDRRHFHPTDMDALWLKACGIAWSGTPAFQLPMDFCERPQRHTEVRSNEERAS